MISKLILDGVHTPLSWCPNWFPLVGAWIQHWGSHISSELLSQCHKWAAVLTPRSPNPWQFSPLVSGHHWCWESRPFRVQTRHHPPSAIASTKLDQSQAKLSAEIEHTQAQINISFHFQILESSPSRYNQIMPLLKNWNQILYIWRKGWLWGKKKYHLPCQQRLRDRPIVPTQWPD